MAPIARPSSDPRQSVENSVPSRACWKTLYRCVAKEERKLVGVPGAPDVARRKADAGLQQNGIRQVGRVDRAGKPRRRRRKPGGKQHLVAAPFVLAALGDLWGREERRTPGFGDQRGGLRQHDRVEIREREHRPDALVAAHRGDRRPVGGVVDARKVHHGVRGEERRRQRVEVAHQHPSRVGTAPKRVLERQHDVHPLP